MKILGIIPSRYASTRLPGKPLALIKNKPMLEWVWEAASSSKLINRVAVATDSDIISDFCNKIGAEVFLSPRDLPSGTDRIIYTIEKYQLDYDIILNIQGDEPLLTGDLIDKLIAEFLQSKADVGTLIKKISNKEELFSPSIVKVVIGANRNALYFSRAVIPHLRGFSQDEYLNHFTFWKHIGIYAYTKKSLELFSKLPEGMLEKAEKLEQLRLLEASSVFKCIETDLELISIDTKEDLERINKILNDLPDRLQNQF